MTDIAYATEDPLSLEPELVPLLPAHMAEFDVYGPPFVSAPNLELYRKLAAAGFLFAVTARHDDDLIAYALLSLAPDPHHTIGGKPVLLASTLAWHILPDWRPRVARGFFRAIEIASEQRGAALLGIRARPGERVSEFLEAVKFVEAERIMVKPIGVAAGASVRSLADA